MGANMGDELPNGNMLSNVLLRAFCKAYIPHYFSQKSGINALNME